MMKSRARIQKNSSRLFSILVCCAGAVPAVAAPTFTGDVEVDFTTPGTFILVDAAGIDVGVPTAFPVGTVSGNDMKDVRLFYDAASDVLYVGINTYVIAGDVDGDGDPSVSSSTLNTLGGIDIPDFGGTESFTLLLDLNEDGVFDVTAGVSASTDINGYSVNTFSGSPYVPPFSFGTPLSSHIGAVHGSPNALEPDLEFTILNFSLLPYAGADLSDSFGINIFVGSFSDGGIGEDYIPGAGQTVPVCFDADGDGVSSCLLYTSDAADE